jgi:hypothetical protein
MRHSGLDAVAVRKSLVSEAETAPAGVAEARSLSARSLPVRWVRSEMRVSGAVRRSHLRSLAPLRKRRGAVLSRNWSRSLHPRFASEPFSHPPAMPDRDAGFHGYLFSCARRSDDTDARKEALRCFGRSDRSAQRSGLRNTRVAAADDGSPLRPSARPIADCSSFMVPSSPGIEARQGGHGLVLGNAWGRSIRNGSCPSPARAV